MPDPQRDYWTRIDHHFRELVDLDEEARAGALAELQRTDPQVAEEVRNLLSHAGLADESFEQALRALPAGLLDAALEHSAGASLTPDARIGPYRLVEEIDRGGWGTVYRAERADGAYEHEVAIKVLRRGLDTDDVLQRFRDERQILAALTHPHIANLIDGGALEDGRPYLVMEFVDGRPIDVFCDEEKLALQQRLKLFLQVCAAVEHAHGELVLHRDLKPSNILVRADGTACLLDFGVARILSPNKAQKRYTRTGQRLLTPQFAAPEQIEDGHVSVTTDVYQLGLLLHRLLGARSAFRVAVDASRAELYRAIRHGRVVAPSGADLRPGSPPAHLLEGDLDTIVLKALRTEPERRYQSVHALASDIRAYLGGYPVSARPDSFRYRAGKFVRRNPSFSMAAGIAVLLLFAVAGLSIAFGLSSQQQARALAAERDRAEQHAALAQQEMQKTEQVMDYLITLFEAADPAQHLGEPLTAVDLLESGAEQAAQITEPAARANLLTALARVHLERTDYAKARELFGEAHTLRVAGYGDAVDLAQSHRFLGQTARHMDMTNEAEMHYQAALALIRADADSRPMAETRLLDEVATLRRQQGRYLEADSLYRHVLDQQHAAGHDDPVFFAQVYGNHAVTLRDLDRYSEARDAAERALHLAQEQFGDIHPEVERAHRLLGSIYREPNPRVERHIRESLAQARALFGEDAVRVARNWNDYAIFLRMDGRLEAAEAAHRRALAIRRAHYNEESVPVVQSRTNLAVTLIDQGRYAEAEALLQQAVQGSRTARGRRHATTARVLYWHAVVLVRMQRHEAALLRLEEALDIQQTQLPDGHQWTMQTTVLLEQMQATREAEL